MRKKGRLPNIAKPLHAAEWSGEHAGIDQSKSTLYGVPLGTEHAEETQENVSA